MKERAQEFWRGRLVICEFGMGKEDLEERGEER